MSDIKVKIYKNPQRQEKEIVVPYIPQYQLLGVEPEEFKSSIVPPGTVTAKPTGPVASRNRSISVRQPYASPAQSPVGLGKGLVPNVGNNMEHTWVSVDGEIIDDLENLEVSDHSFIDNNDYVTDASLGENTNSDSVVLPEPEKSFLSAEDLQSVLKEDPESANIKAMSKLHADTYILLVDDQIICAGELEDVQEMTSQIVFGEHENYKGEAVSLDRVLVLKKINIKMGLFLG